MKRRRPQYDYYIMNAAPLVGKKGLTVEDAHAFWPGKGTLLVAKRERGYETFSRVFISGSGHGYEEKPCSKHYVQDTGMGYGTSGELIIENVIEFDEDSNIVNKMNDIGLDEKRRVWCMK